MLLLKISLSFFFLFSFQAQSSLFSLSPFSLLQQINSNKRKHPLETNSLLSVPNKRKKKGKQSRTNTSAPSLNESLNQDMENHFNDKQPRQSPYKCAECPDEFKIFSTFYIHKIKKHSFEKEKHTFICPTCNQLLFFKSDLKNHEKSHSKIKPFKCDICQKSYRFNSDLISHKENLHKNTPSLCFFCKQLLNTPYELNQHYKNRHPNQKLVCEHCGHLAINRSSVPRHETACIIKKHIENNPCQCFVCKESFNDVDQVSQHYIDSHPKNDLICEYCGRLFTDKYVKRNHEESCRRKKNHKSETFIKCAHCKKTFKNKNTIKIHEKSCIVRKHIKNNPCQCFVCKKSFNNPDTLKEHSKDIHPKNDLICEYCGQLSTAKNSSKKHKQTCKSKKTYQLEIGNNNPLDSTNIEEDSSSEESFDWSTYFEENDPMNLNQVICDKEEIETRLKNPLELQNFWDGLDKQA